MSNGTESPRWPVELQAQDRDGRQARTQSGPGGTAVAGAEHTNVGADIKPVWDVRVYGNVIHGSIGEIAADVRPVRTPINCLENVPLGVAKTRESGHGDIGGQ